MLFASAASHLNAQEPRAPSSVSSVSAREYRDSNEVTSIIHHYGANTRRELRLITRGQIIEEILTGNAVLKGRKILASRGENFFAAHGDRNIHVDAGVLVGSRWRRVVYWETSTPLLTPVTLASAEKTHSRTSALTQILPDHLAKGALTQTLPDRLVTGAVPSVSASGGPDQTLPDHPATGVVPSGSASVGLDLLKGEHV